MIRYQLVCEKGHAFDGWFAGSAGFDEQKKAGRLECPACGSHLVEKALMTPAVPAKGRARGRDEAETESAGKPQPVIQPDPKEAELKTALRKLREHVTANADYVGDKFAEEARKIHYKEAESRGIYGEASAEEARALSEEGIVFHPLPALPEDHN
ncbi:MAG TPA: DUF1178 family protein [Hyphomicrobiales bacterium]|nr:DUF1178 family protein [Hyphomicrobiales bacterium]